MKTYLQDFLKTHDLSDIKKHIVGELDEYSTNEYTAFFGNGELIICEADSELETVYVIDHIGFNEYLIEY